MKFYAGQYVLKTIQSGIVVEQSTGYAPQEKRKRSPRITSHDREKKSKNRRATIRKLARLVSANFTKVDVVCTLTYAPAFFPGKGMPAGLTEEQQQVYVRKAAEKQLRLFFDRLRSRCKKNGVALLYIGVTSDTDGYSKESVRVHHHVIINKAASEYVEDVWKKGFVQCDCFKPNGDNRSIAAYFISQVQSDWHAKSYVASRNLNKPITTISIVPTLDLPPLPLDAIVVEISTTGNRVVYLRRG